MSKGIKRALSLALCVVMLVSCWVFTAPTANAATAGNYYVEIDVNIVTRTEDYSNPYAAPFFGSNVNSYKKMAGITLLYKEQNGTADAGADSNADHIYDHQKFENFGIGKNDYVTEKGNESTAKPHIAKTAGKHTLTATITGFPTAFCVYNNRSGGITDNYAEWSVKEIRVGASADSTLTSIWKGDCFTSNRDGGYSARWIVKQDGTVERWDNNHMTVSTVNDSGGANFWVWNEYYNGGDPNATLLQQTGDPNGNKNNLDESKCQTYTHSNTAFWNKDVSYYTGANANTYKRAWAMPRPTTITDITGDSSISVNTDDSTNTESYTLGSTVKDQYGVDWYQDAEWDTATVQNGVTFSNGTLTVPASANRSTDYTVTLNEKCGDATNSKTVTINTFDYDVTFYDEDGTTVLDNRTVDYGASALAPTATKPYDSTNHYVFDEWQGDSFTNITSGAKDKTVTASYTTVAHSMSLNGSYNDDGHTLACSGCAYTEQEAHDMSAPTTITPATCTTDGLQTSSCNDCAYSTNTTIPATGHSKVEAEYSPEDGLDNIGTVYITCENCDACWGATYNAVTHEYEQTTPDAQPAANVDAAIEASIDAGNIVPAPAFNRFNDRTIKYNYAQRGASLKLSDPKTYTDCFTRQALRFTASLAVPEDVSYLCGDTSQPNRLIDFGYVYSQTELIGNDISNLYEGAPNVYKMSVAENNSALGPYDGTNWSGVSHHTSNGDVLTFNLVVRIKAHNWNTDYCARAYLTYIYNGHTYTVYDSDFSSRSVVTIATAVVGSSSETETAKRYCQNKILNNYQAAIDEWESLQPNA